MHTPLHLSTPLFNDHHWSETHQCNIWLKMDCYQPVASFKIRGIGLHCQRMKEKGCTHFISASGGNAGLATAYAGKMLNVPTTVVVPASTSSFMADKIRQLGAQVLIHGQIWDEANEKAIQLAQHPDVAYIHPFDHPDIWEGHATAIEECAQQIDPPDVIIVAVGGGGYFSGICQGIRSLGWGDTDVITAETFGAASMKASMDARKHIAIDKIDTVATTLGAKKIANQSFQDGITHQVQSYAVNDTQALSACKTFLNEWACLVEPACGAALCAIYEEKLDILSSYNSALVMVCGGAGMQIDQFENIF